MWYIPIHIIVIKVHLFKHFVKMQANEEANAYAVSFSFMYIDLAFTYLLFSIVNRKRFVHLFVNSGLRMIKVVFFVVYCIFWRDVTMK